MRLFGLEILKTVFVQNHTILPNEKVHSGHRRFDLFAVTPLFQLQELLTRFLFRGPVNL